MSARPARLFGPLTACVLLFCIALLGSSAARGAERSEDRDTGTSHSVDISDAMRSLIQDDWIEADRRYGDQESTPTDVAADVSTAQDAAGGCDGVKNGLWGFHVASGEQDPWWQVDLGQRYTLDRVEIYNRCDGANSRTGKVQILVGDHADAGQPDPFRQVYQHDGQAFGGATGKPLVVRFDDQSVSARVVRLRIPGRCSFALDEIEVYAKDNPQVNIALDRPADQISVSKYSRRGTASDADFARLGFQPLVPRAQPAADGGSGFPLAHTREVLQAARQLAARLRPLTDADSLAKSIGALEALQTRLQKLQDAAQTDERERRDVYLAARSVKRQIALQNPRLQDIQQLLFIKRHDSGGVFHMCDQYYGCNAKPGGGLFVLHDPFSERPRLVDLLQDSVVQQGRLAGQKLEGGSFLSPEVSFDGQTILFAYSQALAQETYQWAPEYSYHIFRVAADGSDLVQLTDGPADDFDPCFLPNGRVVFVSERRGGYLRCGRHCPVYTLFSMRPDGSDIFCLSFHETHEWHPSVTNDGMLVYSRWDYVDRDTNIAHHIWTCYPDGRDPRSLHGNYPERRESRPWMEMSIRAVPESNKFVAVTGAHHGHAFGSLVLIDPRLEDDGAMSQLTRLTPEVPFPEAEGRPIANYMIYGTPWPLSEDDFLCVYGADARNRGIYWIDRFGNRELIYRDPEISCLSPIPLQPRPMPPVIPTETSQAAEDAHRERPATVAVMNIYDADFDWPEDTQIKALRIIQLLPKSTAPPNEPRIGIANQTNARAVLGTVPVEQDGSVYFEAPVGKPIYFQAIDQHGTAVQSMRSVTYVHPGEQLTCQGCHERKHRPPALLDPAPLALRREPSRIEPDVDGSNPFNYVRLVQPVLDRKCVACHEQEQALDLSGAGGGPHGWTRSYTNLADKYGFYFHVSNGSINTGVHGGSRTIPGQFGARAAELRRYLGPEHYGVQLTPEELQRVTLWLDCNSEFYGSYENTQAQACGEIVLPTLE
jgi:hypothetical protein